MSRRPAADSLLPTVVLATLLAVAAPVLARTSDRNKPLDVESSRSDCSIGDGPCSFTGNVVMTQGTLEVNAAQAVLTRNNGDIRRVVLTGAPARMSQQMDNGAKVDARAGRIDYDLSTDTVVFTGDAHLDQPGRGSIAGERIVYNMESGQIQGGGDGAGRVKMRILPKNAAPQPAADDAAPAQGGG
jgi:lipopolysaccharide export system protein LptA